ncbi:hypothetical protein COY23_03655 [bacterium (Candidatus Torokbacteria) CG_4_10_14_0_2_um_filter_35_8]|nr:MAG: hypothetical protein COY23_03655 [bacterium (Candidatus Torokbacteria) CG_4_10_14_0_2_um_filter_35_8]
MLIRNNYFLENRLNYLWQKHFPDIKKINLVRIKFGRKARRQLGSIRFDPQKNISRIIITSYFRSSKVPSFVIDSTIAHELTHFAQGFASHHKKLLHYPHQGGVVNKELDKRGLKEKRSKTRKWLKENWLKFIKNYDRTKRK